MAHADGLLRDRPRRRMQRRALRTASQPFSAARRAAVTSRTRFSRPLPPPADLPLLDAHSLGGGRQIRSICGSWNSSSGGQPKSQGTIDGGGDGRGWAFRLGRRSRRPTLRPAARDVLRIGARRLMPAAGGGASTISFACVRQRFGRGAAGRRVALRVALRPHTCVLPLLVLAVRGRAARILFARSQVLL